MPLLPILALPERVESVSGYLLRMSNLNGVRVREVLTHCRAAHDQLPHISDAELLADLLGAPAAWFDHRTPKHHVRDRWQETVLFGISWRDVWLLRGLHQQVCPSCIRERGIARLEWDLVAYPACHIHGIVLQDLCRKCGKSISPNRPALDVCHCGRYLFADEDKSGAAAPSVKAWVSWLSERLLSEKDASGSHDLLRFAPQLYGMSPDGAFRLICAFAGGAKALRGEQITGETPWLSSLQISRLLAQGLDVLHAKASGKVLAAASAGTPYALAEQASAGITAWDRAGAAREMRRLRLGRRWRNAFPPCPMQRELFADTPRGATDDGDF